MWCKHTNFELDTRAPLIIAAPGMRAAGQKTDALTEFVDIYPTLCAVAGLPLPKHLEGTSAAPLLDRPALRWKTAAFSQYPRGAVMGRSMRTARWRYTEWREIDGGKETISVPQPFVAVVQKGIAIDPRIPNMR